MLLAHEGEAHSSTETSTETHESAVQLQPSPPASSNIIAPLGVAILASGITILVVYALTHKRKSKSSEN